MEKAGRGIVQAVEQKPDKARTVDRFARYYLPEVVKIMSAYAQMEKRRHYRRKRRPDLERSTPQRWHHGHRI